MLFTQPLSRQLKGTLITVLGVLFISPDVLFIRLVADIPNFTVQFIKFSLVAVALLTPFTIYHGRNVYLKFIGIGKNGLVAGLVWGFSNVFYINAAQQTYAGNLLVILASSPMFAAIFSYILQHEIVKIRTIISCLVSFGVIIVIFMTDSSSQAPGNELLGNIFAVLSAVTMGLYYSILSYIG